MGYQRKLRWLSTEVFGCLWVAARLATVQQQYMRAATLFGLAEQMRHRVHYAVDGLLRPQVDAAETTVREALDPAVFAEAFATGQQMTLEEAFATLLAVTSAPDAYAAF